MKNLILLFILFISVYVEAQIYSNPINIAATDAFGRQRVSNPQTIFDAQFTYDLQPLLYEQITSSGTCVIAHDATNRTAKINFNSATSTEECIMQSFEHFRYQPGKSQDVFITFNMRGGVANNTKFAGYSDGNNGIEFIVDSGAPAFRILSLTDAGDVTVTQENWNINRFDYTTGDTLDLTKTQILVIDFQALYVGRVRVGFETSDGIKYAHEFEHANIFTNPYFQSANLPIRVGMIAGGTVTDSMEFICTSVISEGGQEVTSAYEFTQSNSVTAGSGTRTHLLSIRPDTLFNGIENRAKIVFDGVSILVTGANPVKWELVVGQALTGTTTFSEVNSTYSAVDYNTDGTLSGDPAVVIDHGFISASNQVTGEGDRKINFKYPITLNADGSPRNLGTLTLLVTGIGGTSACQGGLTWSEIR